MRGTILGSRYRIIEYIAKGGFGKTYLAEDTQLPGKDKCVVKQLYPSVDDPYFIKVARRLFKTEAETLHNLGNHNQIPRLLAYFEEDEKFYLVQQYIEGHTLSPELTAKKPWSETKVIELLKNCLNILDFIHTKGVIHRDVKPDNLIRRNYDNQLVLVDFGSVKEVIVEQTQKLPSTVAVGTRGYMPSEQARGKPRTVSDIYALGIIAAQALTGVHPIEFQEDDNGEIVWQNLAQCTQELKEIITKMTRYHFKDRYQSAQEILRSLNNLDDQKAAFPKTEAIQYTPTVQLNSSQLANMAEANKTVVPPEVPPVPNDQSILATPGNSATSSHSAFVQSNPKPLSQLPENSHFNPVIENEPSNFVTKSNNSSKSKTLATLGIALVVGAAASGGMYFLKQQTAKHDQDNLAQQVEDFNQMLEQSDYKTCYEKVTTINTDTTAEASKAIMMPEVQQREFEANCGLEFAKEKALDLKYSEALAIAKTLPENTSLDVEVQQKIESWSKQILQQATKLYEEEGQLEEAIETVNQIPENTPVRQKVIDAKDSWKTEYKTNEATLASAQKALSNEKWLFAKQQASKVDDSASAYWQAQAKAVISQAEDGMAATSPANNQTVTDAQKINTNPSKPIPESQNHSSEAAKPPVVIRQEKAIAPVTPPPKPVVPEPTPEPAFSPSVTLEELRDLNGDANSPQGIPDSPSQNNQPLRDL